MNLLYSQGGIFQASNSITHLFPLGIPQDTSNNIENFFNCTDTTIRKCNQILGANSS